MRSRYDRVAPLYDLLDSPFEAVYARGRRLIGEASHGLTLELGAGTGKNFAYYPPGARVIALDVSQGMLTRARRRIRQPIRGLVVGDVALLPLRDASVDVVTATFVCCVQHDPPPALDQIRRVLRPGGQAVFMDYVLPGSGWLRSLLCALEPGLRALYGVSWLDDLATLLQAAGLQPIERRPVWGSLIVVTVAARLGLGRSSG
jgi:phosphatidylethanolamine/phosphatidyl-N-methylethanolamine N-methyltransferase